MLSIGVGNEDLSKCIACHEADDLFHALGIKFVEDVIEQEQGSGFAACAFKEVKLGKFEGNHVGFVLPL